MPIFLAPLRLYDGGTYAISDVKEVLVTEDYLGLDEEVRKCQVQEIFEECTTRNYLTAIQEQCNCIPYSLRTFPWLNQVRFFKEKQKREYYLYTSVPSVLEHMHP